MELSSHDAISGSNACCVARLDNVLAIPVRNKGGNRTFDLGKVNVYEAGFGIKKPA